MSDTEETSPTLPGPSSQKEPPVSPRPPPQHHVTMNALQVAVVSSIFTEDRGNEMHATCLALCNAFRDGVSLPFLRVCCRTPHSLVHPTLCPESPSALPVTASTAGARSSSGASTTNSSRVLPYRRISSLDLEWNYGDLLRCTPKWPVGVQCIHLTKLSVPLIDISLPTTLTRLSFGDAFTIPWVKHSIVGMAPWWPAGLRELYLGLTFDGSIANVEWPPGLEKLSMPAFTQPIEGARWPAGLETLEFLQRSDINERKRGIYTVPLGVAPPLFNSPIAGAETYLPPGLRTLWLSDGFNQDVEDVDWPSQLREVGFGQQFQRSFLQGVVWPSTLKRLYLVDTHGLGNSTGKIPSGCEVIVIKLDLYGEEVEDSTARADEEEELGLLDGDWDHGNLTDYEEDWGEDAESDFSL